MRTFTSSARAMTYSTIKTPALLYSGARAVWGADPLARLAAAQRAIPFVAQKIVKSSSARQRAAAEAARVLVAASPEVREVRKVVVD